MTTREKVVEAIRRRCPYLLIEPADIRVSKRGSKDDVYAWEAFCGRKDFQGGEKVFHIGAWSGLRAVAADGVQVLKEEFLFLEIA